MLNKKFSELELSSLETVGMAVADQFYKAGYKPELLDPSITQHIAIEESTECYYGDGGGEALGVFSKETVEQYPDPLEYMFAHKLSVSSNTVNREGDNLKVTTSVSDPHLNRFCFECDFQLTASQGIPASVYQAVGFLAIVENLSAADAIELFSAALFSLASECFDWVDFANGDDFFFNGEASLVSDLYSSNVSAKLTKSITTEALIGMCTLKTSQFACKGREFRFSQFQEATKDTLRLFGNIPNIAEIEADFLNRLQPTSNWGHIKVRKQLIEAINTVIA